MTTILLLLTGRDDARTGAARDLRTVVGAWVSAHQPQIVKELVDLLAIPNVAADRANIRRNAEHLRGMLAARGFKAELLETGGNPLVYGELAVPGATRTLLLYSHYDGQPVDAEGVEAGGSVHAGAADGERRPGGTDIPSGTDVTRFEPEWRLYARSASDDKSPIVAICAALDALTASVAPPDLERARHPRRRGGGQLAEPGARHREVPRSAARPTSWSSSTVRFTRAARPTIAYGARGIVTLNLTVFGPKAGVHSGNYGNWVPNPAERLAALLATMKDDDGQVLVAGFNDGIQPLVAGRAGDGRCRAGRFG